MLVGEVTVQLVTLLPVLVHSVTTLPPVLQTYTLPLGETAIPVGEVTAQLVTLPPLLVHSVATLPAALQT
jgi:hypothetical protein